MRYFHNETILRPNAARTPSSGAGGSIVYLPARDASGSGEVLRRTHARRRRHLSVTLYRAAMLPGDGPTRRAAELPQSFDLRRSARDDVMADFSICMNNTLRFSNCSAPHIPTSKSHKETLFVELRGDHLTITERRADGSLGSRIHAQRSIDLPDTSIFTILPELPSHIRDGSFFPALGTAVILAAQCGGPRRLRAVGTDVNSGQCHGWIFDATETAEI